MTNVIISGITALRQDRIERRAVRARRAALERELASFRTEREVDDLLGTIRDQDSPEADQIRDILLDNLRPAGALYRTA